MGEVKYKINTEGVMRMFTALNNFDINAIMFIHKYTQNIVFDKIMPYITYMGSKGMVWIIISLLLIVQAYRNNVLMCIAFKWIFRQYNIKKYSKKVKTFYDNI